MNTTNKYFLIFIALLSSCIVQEQKLTAAVSKNKVTVREVFQLTFSVNANGKKFTPPSFSDFSIYSGPKQSTSTQIINGNMSDQSITFSYYLSAKKEGTFVIGAASINVGGHTLQSNSVTIEVEKE